MEKIYYCERGCHVTDKDKNLCPECGSFLKETDASSKDSILANIAAMQKESGQDALRGRYVNNRI